METTLKEVLTNPETYENCADHIPEKEEGEAFALRKLAAKDIAPMAAIINKIGWKQFKEAFNQADIKVDEEGKVDIATLGMAVGFDIVGIVLANYEKCQNDIFSFLASLSGMNVKQIESLPLADFAAMVIAVVQKEEFNDFFTVVSKLFK